METTRGVFFDEESAHAVARELRQSGWQADVTVERLAGEDDDEDHQWAVVTDAPVVRVELLVDTHEGWLDHEPHSTTPDPPPAPLDLPSGPRRIKRPTQ